MKKFFNKIFDSFLWQPLRGGNGITQMSELAQYVSVILLCMMVVKEGLMEGDQYSDMEFWAIATLVGAISGFRLANKDEHK